MPIMALMRWKCGPMKMNGDAMYAANSIRRNIRLVQKYLFPHTLIAVAPLFL
jgi:hypothetical protein